MSPRKKSPPHPIAKAIDDVLAAGHTPRIHVDARRPDVTVPDHVRERWQARLVIDLDPGWPLNLEHEKDGLGVDLAFQGLVSRCKFGWGAIYVVLDRATGRGTVIEANLPPHELAPETNDRVGELPRRKDGLRPGLTAVAPLPVADEASVAADKPRRGKKKPSTDVASPEPRAALDARAPAAVDDGAPIASRGPEVPSSETSSSDDRARERRARFRVINGGG